MKINPFLPSLPLGGSIAILKSRFRRNEHSGMARAPDCVNTHRSLPGNRRQSGSYRDRSPKTGVLPRRFSPRDKRKVKGLISLSAITSQNRYNWESTRERQVIIDWSCS